MTKYLVRIISICAFVVLIPVIIAGVALSALGSQMFKLSIFVVGADNVNATYSVSVAKKGEETEKGNSPYYFQNDTDVSVVASAEGYDFLGWYKGDDKTYTANPELTKDAIYQFAIKANTQLTASFSSKHYTVNFTNATYEDGTDFTHDPVEIRYGDKILRENPTPKASETAQFLGWHVTSEDAGFVADLDVNETAKFDQTTVGDKYVYNATPIWSNSEKISYVVKVKDTEITLTTDHKSQAAFESYTLLTEEEIKGLLKQKEIYGYSYKGLKNANGDEINQTNFTEKYPFNANSEAKIYVDVEAIQYTINVKNPEVMDSKTATLHYSVDGFVKADIDALTRNGYDFKGLKLADEAVYNKELNGDTYDFRTETNELLSDYILRQDATTLDVTSVWTVQDAYKSITVRIVAIYEYDETEYSVYYGEQDDDLDGIYTKEVNDESGIALEQDILDAIFGDNFRGFTFNAFAGEDGSKVEVEFSEIKFVTKPGLPAGSVRENHTVWEVINEDFDGSTDITIQLIFKKKAA